MSCAREIADTVEATIPELYLLGTPPASVVAFGSRHPNVNILEVGDAMAQRGWHLNGLANPPAFHIACTVRLYACLFGSKLPTSIPAALDYDHGR